MNLQELITSLNLTIWTKPQDFASLKPTGGYVSDLLSCVMAGAKSGNVWITIQAHLNIVAVAALTEVSAIIITENAAPEPEVIARADEQGVILLGTPKSNYEIAGRLWEMGIR